MTQREGEYVNEELATSIESVFYADIPGRKRLRHSDISHVLGLSDNPAIRESFRYRMALAHALTHCGKSPEAARLAHAVILPNLDRDTLSMSPSDVSVAYCILSEIFLLTSDIQLSAHYAELGMQENGNMVNKAVTFWATSLYALAKASAGELSGASKAVIAALKIQTEAPWKHGSWPLSLAREQVSTQQQLGAFFNGAAPPDQPPDTFHDPVLVNATDILAKALRQIRRHDYTRLLGTVVTLTSGIDAQHYPPFISAEATILEVLGLLESHSVTQAKESLKGRSSPPCHAFCYDMLRACVAINQGEYSTAIRVTEACTAPGTGHCLSSLAGVYICRATALDLLDKHDEADKAFSLGAHIAMTIGVVSPVLGLPDSTLESLYRRLIAKEKDFGTTMRAVIAPGSTRKGTIPVSPPTMSKLTGRERTVARYLDTSMTLAQIADTLFVSPNTIKTQVKSIYRKLGVHSRSEACRHLGGWTPTTKHQAPPPPPDLRIILCGFHRWLHRSWVGKRHIRNVIWTPRNHPLDPRHHPQCGILASHRRQNTCVRPARI